jgi:hypothetical protein
MIRPLASFSEISDVIDVMEAAHRASKWALVPGAAVDRKEAQAVLTRANQRMGLMKEGGTLLNVAEHQGKIHGFMLGSIGRLYICGTLLCAYDEMLYVLPGGDPMDGIRLVKAYLDWAQQVKGVANIILQQTDFIAGEHEDGVRRFYAHLGFKQTGTIFEKARAA